MIWNRLMISFAHLLALITFQRNTQMSFKIMTVIHLHSLQFERS